jgi:methyltransferase NSUN6
LFESIQIITSSVPSEADQLLKVRGFPPESFDRILLDPPCSAWGLRPKLCIDHTSIAQLESIISYQHQFIAVAVQLLKPGGILTYSTCTIHTGENETMVRYILEKYPTIKLLPIRISGVGGPGWTGYGLSAEQCTFVRRFDPSDRAVDDTIGFFIAKFRKDSDHL